MRTTLGSLPSALCSLLLALCSLLSAPGSARGELISAYTNVHHFINPLEHVAPIYAYTPEDLSPVSISMVFREEHRVGLQYVLTTELPVFSLTGLTPADSGMSVTLDATTAAELGCDLAAINAILAESTYHRDISHKFILSLATPKGERTDVQPFVRTSRLDRLDFRFDFVVNSRTVHPFGTVHTTNLTTSYEWHGYHAPEPAPAVLLLFGLCVCVLASRHHHTAHFFRQ